MAPSTVRHHSPRVYSDAVLRSESAEILVAALAGIRKLVAASLHVSISRIDRQCEGLDANMLEVLAKALDRVEREEGVERVEGVLAWLCGRYGRSLATVLPVRGTVGVPSALAKSIRESAEADAAIVTRLEGGISADELPEIEREIHEAIEAKHRLRREVQAAAGNAVNTVRKLRA